LNRPEGAEEERRVEGGGEVDCIQPKSTPRHPAQEYRRSGGNLQRGGRKQELARQAVWRMAKSSLLKGDRNARP